MSDAIRKSQKASPRTATAARGSLLVPGVGERDGTTWNAVAFQQQLMGSLALSDPLAFGSRVRGIQRKRRTRIVRKPEVPSRLSFLSSEKQQKLKKQQELESEEYVLDAKPQPLTLAQKLGLVDQPTAPLTHSQWASAKAKSNARNDSLLPCVICKEPFAYQQQVLLSCSHVFHHACLSAFERFTCKKTCPLCREKDYQTRVIHEGAKMHRVCCAILIQSAWRGYRVRRWYSELRKTVPPMDPKLRRKFYEEKFQEANNRFVRKVEETGSVVRNVIQDVNESLAYSRRVFAMFDSVIGQQVREKAINWGAIRAKAVERGVNECPICIVALDVSLIDGQDPSHLSIGYLGHCKNNLAQHPGMHDKHPGMHNKHPGQNSGNTRIRSLSGCESLERGQDCVEKHRRRRMTVLLSCSHAFHEPCFEMFEQFCTGSYDPVCPVCRSPYLKLTLAA